MIVMKFLDMPWQMLSEVIKNSEGVIELRKKVVDSITRLHGNGMVDGDIRNKNLMADDENNIMIIDFDWSGVEGQAVYPQDISLAPVLNRPPDVKPGGKILFNMINTCWINCLLPVRS